MYINVWNIFDLIVFVRLWLKVIVNKFFKYVVKFFRIIVSIIVKSINMRWYFFGIFLKGDSKNWIIFGEFVSLIFCLEICSKIGMIRVVLILLNNLLVNFNIIFLIIWKLKGLWRINFKINFFLDIDIFFIFKIS